VLVGECLELGPSWLIDDVLGGRRWGGGHDRSISGPRRQLVRGAVGAKDPDGVEVLAAVRAIDPRAVRVAAVGWGDWHSVRSVFGAVTVGTLDHWVTCPVQAPAEEFHRSVTEFLREWSSQQGGGFEPVQVIGKRWSARSQELRDLFARHRVPAGFYDATSGHAGACCTNLAWRRRNCR
jgi:hypothetical protein